MEDEICDGPSLRELGSLTETHLHGFIANFAANHAAPLCDSCVVVAEAIRAHINEAIADAKASVWSRCDA